LQPDFEQRIEVPVAAEAVASGRLAQAEDAA
jgi:hypothetical protein